MKPQSWMLIAALAASLAACDRPTEEAKAPASAEEQAAAAATAAAGPLERPELTVKDIMNLLDPGADLLFESVQEVSDDKGTHQKAPSTDAEWAEVQKHLQVLSDSSRMLIQAGRKGGRAGDTTEFPEVENTPEQIQHLMDTQRPDWVAKSNRLRDAAAEGLTAVQARSVPGLSAALLSIDKACESCHLVYFYPGDERAKQAAREEGLIK